MKQLFVKASAQDYTISIGKGIHKHIQSFLSKDYSSILIITDDQVADLYLDSMLNTLHHPKVHYAIIPAGEASKNINQFYKLHSKALNCHLDRQSLIIALGGGVVGDLAGFVAATFMRGIDYIQVPTTILAHDSSVGGKVAINHELGKNLIGNFYAPTAVIYDVEMLTTLPDKEIRSGYAELIKEALIADENLFFQLLQSPLKNIQSDQLTEFLLKGISIKADIVQRDEKEAGDRKFLNLGHTLGHALEAEYSYQTLAHGEAVAIGLLFAMRISEQIFSVKLPVTDLKKWFNNNNFPLHIQSKNIESIINHMKQDKKTIKDQIQMVLLKEIGKPTVKVIKEETLKSYLKQFAKELTTR